MRLTVAGCAGSFPGPDGPSSCYLLEAEGFRLLLDLGDGALSAVQRHAGLSGIDAICLSHLHADHCVGLYSYKIARQYAPGGPLPPIPVYGPEGTAERIGRINDAGHDEDLADRFAFVTLEPGRLEIGPFTVTTEHMNHPVETFGFRVEHDDSTLAYSADTGETDALTRLAADADVLLCEASFHDVPGLPPGLHLSGRQAGEYADRAGAGSLVLTHLQPWNDPERTLAEAGMAFSGPILLAVADGVISLGR